MVELVMVVRRILVEAVAVQVQWVDLDIQELVEPDYIRQLQAQVPRTPVVAAVRVIMYML